MRFSSKDGGLLVRDSTTTPCLLFPDLCDRPLSATFDLDHASSDGGAVLLKAADRRLGLISRLAGALVDERQAGKVRHALSDLLGQRIYGLALGYEDANDATRLIDDPIHKLLLDRDPIAGDALASQPTLSRFENDVTRGELKAMGVALFETVLERHRKRRRKGAPHHRRPRRHRRSNARRAADGVLQRLLRQLVLPADAGVPDLQR